MPQLFVGDGSQAVSRPGRYPWTMGFLQSYIGEGAIYGRHLAQNAQEREDRRPLREHAARQGDDARARALDQGRGPASSRRRLRALDTDVSAQMARLKASGADTLMLFATPKFAIQGFAAAHRLAWKPQVYVAAISIEPGSWRSPA